jgi:hypothetical protein
VADLEKRWLRGGRRTASRQPGGVSPLGLFRGRRTWRREPHYLIITQSLLNDGDLKIENNHAQEDFRSYFGGRLRPDFLRRGQDGDYSIHAPGSVP